MISISYFNTPKRDPSNAEVVFIFCRQGMQIYLSDGQQEFSMGIPSHLQLIVVLPSKVRKIRKLEFEIWWFDLKGQ